MAKTFILKCSDCHNEFEVMPEIEASPPAGQPVYCSKHFATNYNVQNVPYIANFVAFLEEMLHLAEGSKIIVTRAEGFRYLLTLAGKGAAFICTIELKHAGIAEPIQKFMVFFSTKRSGIPNIQTIIDQFVRKHGIEAEASIVSLRKF